MERFIELIRTRNDVLHQGLKRLTGKRLGTGRKRSLHLSALALRSLITFHLLVSQLAFPLCDLPLMLLLSSEVFEGMAELLLRGRDKIHRRCGEEEHVPLVVAVKLVADVFWDGSVGCVAQVKDLNGPRCVGVVHGWWGLHAALRVAGGGGLLGRW